MLDKIIINFDKALKNITVMPKSVRKHPDTDVKDYPLSQQEIRNTIKLMRINHCGEICAQALYQGQAIFAKNKTTQISLDKAAQEEIDHLAWTKHRLDELNGRISIFNPMFYISSLLIGMIASKCGDNISLGFLAETENQVAKHLQQHLNQLSANDIKSKLILQQMLLDEISHEDSAIKAGGTKLSKITKKLMQSSAKVMTSLTSIL